jgi:hypothetical protein
VRCRQMRYDASQFIPALVAEESGGGEQ